MLKAIVLAAGLVFSFTTHAEGLLTPTLSNLLFNKFKTKEAKIKISADCKWSLEDKKATTCKLNHSNQYVELTGKEASAFRDAALKAGAGESSGAGSSWFRDPQVLECVRGEGKKPKYRCSTSAEPSVGPPPEYDVTPPAATGK